MRPKAGFSHPFLPEEWLQTRKNTAVSTPLKSSQKSSCLLLTAAAIFAPILSIKWCHESGSCGVTYRRFQLWFKSHLNLLMLTCSLAHWPMLITSFLYWMICMGTVLEQVRSTDRDTMTTTILGNRQQGKIDPITFGWNGFQVSIQARFIAVTPGNQQFCIVNEPGIDCPRSGHFLWTLDPDLRSRSSNLRTWTWT